MLIKRALNKGDITLIDIRASESQPGLLNILKDVVAPLATAVHDSTVSEEAVRESILSLHVPKITGECPFIDSSVTQIFSSNPAYNTVALKSLLMSGAISGSLMSEASGTVTLHPLQQFYPGPRGKFTGLVKNWGRSCEITRIAPQDLAWGQCDVLSYVPAGASVGKVLFNVFTPFQGPEISACLVTEGALLQPSLSIIPDGGSFTVLSPFALTAGLTGLVSPSAYMLTDFTAENQDSSLSAIFGDTFGYSPAGWPTVNTNGNWNLLGLARVHKYNLANNLQMYGLKLVYSGQGDGAWRTLSQSVATTEDFKLRIVFQQDIPATSNLIIKTFSGSPDGTIYEDGNINIAANGGQLLYYDGASWVNPIGETDTSTYDSSKHVLDIIAAGTFPGYLLVLDGKCAGWGRYSNTRTSFIKLGLFAENTANRNVIDYVSLSKIVTSPVPGGDIFAGDALELVDANSIINKAQTGLMKTAVFYDGPRFPRATKATYFGGWDGSKNLSSIEMFHFASKTGCRKAGVSLLSARREMVVATGESDAKCYIIGGTSDTYTIGVTTAKASTIAETINPACDTVAAVYLTSTNPIFLLRSTIANSDFTGKSYVIGGYSPTFNFAAPAANIPTTNNLLTITRSTGVTTAATYNPLCSLAGACTAATWPADDSIIIAGGRPTSGPVSNNISKLDLATMTSSVIGRLINPTECAASAAGIDAIIICGGLDISGNLLRLVTKYSKETSTASVMCGSLAEGGGQVAAAVDYNKDAAWIIGGGTCPSNQTQFQPPQGLSAVSIMTKSAQCSQCVYGTQEARAGAGAAVL